VIVKDIYHASPSPEEALSVAVPSKVKELKFINSKLFAHLTGYKVTSVTGFCGEYYGYAWFSSLTGFGRVENCSGYIDVIECDNVIHSQIQSAYKCHNLQDIKVVFGLIDYPDPNTTVAIKECSLIDGVSFSVDHWGVVDEYIEFYKCEHISNVRNMTKWTINYVDCTDVVGDTCDGYYTEEDEGKVQTVNTSGEKSLISVYDKETSDAKFADIGEKITTLSDAVTVLSEGVDPDKIDGVKDLVSYVSEHGAEVTGMVQDINTLKEKEEWDYVITKLEDFTTAKLATMSGRVLVKGVNYDTEYVNSVPPLAVTIPASIKVIKFINSTIYAEITAVSKSTAITGFIGGGVEGFFYSIITNFGAVEHCGGCLDVISCNNIMHTRVHICRNCYNLQDITVYGDYSDGIDYGFWNCVLITGVTIERNHGQWNDEDYIVEFKSCKHISNVHLSENSSEGTVINYEENCRFVNGDTCDGYYTAEDNGKVQTVNTSGEKSLISVYDKTEIDGMLGDISTALDELHTYAQSLVNGGATV
jgi:hypothetical protein